MEVQLCGLPLSVATAGKLESCAKFYSALAPHAAASADPRALQLNLRLLEEEQQAAEPLVLRRQGTELLVHGNGVRGEVGERAARLDAYGGRPTKLHTALRLACTLWLAPRGGLLLHGACVEVAEKGLAFLGPSGAGKSTLARKLEACSVHVIADEVVAVRAVPGPLGASEIRVFGHPLNGKVGDGRAPPEGFPLSAIGLLSHATPDGMGDIRRLGSSAAARALIRRVFLPAIHSSLAENALATVASLAVAVPVFELPLHDDDRAVETALSLLDRGTQQTRGHACVP